MKMITLILMLSFLNSYSKDSEFSKIEYSFSPAFLPKTVYTIDIKKRTIREYSYIARVPINQKTSSNSYLLNWRDTLIIKYDKTFDLNDIELKKFIDRIDSSGFITNITHTNPACDGIGFNINGINQNGDTIKLKGSNPFRCKKLELDFELLDAFFELSISSIKDYDGLVILERIQDYFPYGLPIRKICDQPLEYRVWGSLTGCRKDNEKLLTFLNNLPLNKPTILDFRNGSVSYCLEEVFEDYTKNHVIYIYGNLKLSKNKNIRSFATKEDILKIIADN